MTSLEHLPIDIYYSKLQDWLIDRRHCQRQWQASAVTIRQKINVAIQDMPPVEAITTLLKGTYINYFQCRRIVELLKQTDDGSKNMFGRYSSQRMKDWLDIMASYEKDGIYLAEAAQMLTRNVNFEIAGLKKQIEKCTKAQTDCTRKEREYAVVSGDLKEQYHVRCRQLGIEGKKIRKELLDLAKDLPDTFAQVGRDTKSLEKAIDFYSSFTSFMLNSDEKGKKCVPLLNHVLRKGNTTLYEWRAGTEPSSIEENRIYFEFEDEEENPENETEEIDFGGMDDIDFNIDIVDSSHNIDFGDEQDGGIDWSEPESTDTTRKSDDVARGEDAMTLLDFMDTRNQFIDELQELEAFLSQRLLEMRDDTNVIASTQFESAPHSIQVDSQTVEMMLSQVQSMLEMLVSKRMQNLYMIRSSPKYVDRLSSSVKQLLSDSEKQMALSRLMVVRHQEAIDEQASLEPKLEIVRQKTKELQKQLEEEISKKYQNRRVNIMGEINQI